MAATNTINIRGATVTIVTSTSQATGGTTIGIVGTDLELPYKAFSRRDVTELSDRVQQFKVSRLATLEGELSFGMHLTPSYAGNELAGTEKIIRIDLEVEGTGTTTSKVMIYCPVAIASEEFDSGDDESDITLNVTGLPMGAPVWATSAS